jgi:hypothetical protein
MCQARGPVIGMAHSATPWNVSRAPCAPKLRKGPPGLSVWKLTMGCDRDTNRVGNFPGVDPS